MSDKRPSDLNDQLSAIEDVLGPVVTDILLGGLPGGFEERWGYDEQLVNDLAKACRDWHKRTPVKP